MGTKITETEMTSDATRHTAARTDDGWTVTWLPGRTLTQAEAVTAMTIAECVDDALDPYSKRRVWPHVDGWAAELGLSGTDAVAMASLAPEYHAQPGAGGAAGAPRRVRVIDPEPGPVGYMLSLDKSTGRAVVEIDGQTVEMNACRLQYVDDEPAQGHGPLDLATVTADENGEYPGVVEVAAGSLPWVMTADGSAWVAPLPDGRAASVERLAEGDDNGQGAAFLPRVGGAAGPVCAGLLGAMAWCALA